MAELVYLLCAVTSVLCAAALLRGYLHTRARFLLWSSLCFCGLLVNNVLLFMDKVMFPDVELAGWRTSTAVVGLVLLLYGLIWDAEA